MLSTILVAIALTAQADTPEEAAAQQAKEQQKKWNAYYAKTAADYEITRGKDGKEKLELQPEAVLYWSNPVRGGETNGSVFVWTHAGRAEVVGTVFSHLVSGDPNTKVMAHSFQSLSEQPLAGQRPGQPDAWSLEGAGVQPKPIPDAPPPAGTRAGRLAQMRDLAREFSATTTLEGVEQELRLLTQPLYRSEKSVGDVLDGALFTYVTGTDPELMLVIEARPAAGLALRSRAVHRPDAEAAAQESRAVDARTRRLARRPPRPLYLRPLRAVTADFAVGGPLAPQAELLRKRAPLNESSRP